MNGLQYMRWWWVAVVSGACLLPSGLLVAQEEETAPSNHYAKSPVDYFRELLAMTPDEQEKRLADRPAKIRERIEAKLAEYMALDSNERELRLRSTELHWYLLPLMKLPASQRAEQLSRIPPDMRELVQQRLEMWDVLPPPLMEELLENEQIARIFAQSATPTPDQLQKIMAEIPPSRLKTLKAGVERWQVMPEEQRQRLCRQFSQFFDLTPQEKERSLNVLSDIERSQMDKTLKEFEKLPKEQREICVRSFQKFTEMSLPERELFLRNAELWKTMSPDQRQAWRDLVKQVPEWPPLPFGYSETPHTNGI